MRMEIAILGIACTLCAGNVAAQGHFSTPPELVTPPGGNGWSPALQEDGLYMVFSSNNRGGAGGYDLYEASRASVDQPWGNVQPLVQLNAAGEQYEADISYDDTELYYINTSGGSNVWRSTRAGAGAPWGPGQPVGAPLNTNDLDDPRLTQDGLTMFFTAGGAGGADIFTVTRPSIGAPWGNRQLFAPASGAQLDHSPFPEGNGEVVFFGRNGGGTVGSSDFLFVWRDPTTGIYSAPQEVVELNTTNWDSNLEMGDSTGRAIVSVFDAGGPNMWQFCRRPIVVWVRRCVSIVVPKPIFPPRPPWIRWCRVWLFNILVPRIRWQWYDWWNFPFVVPLVSLNTLPGGGLEIPGFESALVLDPSLLIVLGAVPVGPDKIATMDIPGPFPPALIGFELPIQAVGFDLVMNMGVFSEVGVARFQ